jgi:hypothetical protein
VLEVAKSDGKRTADDAMPWSPVGWMNGFSGLKHTYGVHAEARRGFETGNVLLRAVKDVDLRKVLV